MLPSLCPISVCPLANCLSRMIVREAWTTATHHPALLTICLWPRECSPLSPPTAPSCGAATSQAWGGGGGRKACMQWLQLPLSTLCCHHCMSGRAQPTFPPGCSQGPVVAGHCYCAPPSPFHFMDS